MTTITIDDNMRNSPKSFSKRISLLKIVSRLVV